MSCYPSPTTPNSWVTNSLSSFLFCFAFSFRSLVSERPGVHGVLDLRNTSRRVARRRDSRLACWFFSPFSRAFLSFGNRIRDDEIRWKSSQLACRHCLKKTKNLFDSTDIVERITAHGPQYVPARCVEVADAIAARMEKKKKSENTIYLCLHLADFCLKNGAYLRVFQTGLFKMSEPSCLFQLQ